MRGAVLALALMALPLPAVAQTIDDPIVTDERLWFTYAMQDKPLAGRPWHWGSETILRSRNGLENLDAFSLRAGIFRDLSARSLVGGGYQIAWSFPALGRDLTEHRFWGQYLLRLSLSGGTLSFRSRIEDRWIIDDSGHIGRFREQIRYTHTIKPGSRATVIGYGEIFVHLNSTNRYVKGVDHVRLFGGVGVTFTSSMRMEAGYLNQFIPGPGVVPDRMNHILSTSLQLLF